MAAVEDIVIAGAGLAGLATALGLHRQATTAILISRTRTVQHSEFPIGPSLFAAVDVLIEIAIELADKAGGLVVSCRAGKG